MFGWSVGVDVLKEFAAKKCVKLGRLLKERGGLGLDLRKKDSSDAGLTSRSLKSENCNSFKVISLLFFFIYIKKSERLIVTICFPY